MIAIGHLAKTYGMLPSQVAANATTFDLMITDVYATWENYQLDKSSGKAPKTSDYNIDDLKAIMEKTKNGG
jgi:hypothetical protein